MNNLKARLFLFSVIVFILIPACTPTAATSNTQNTKSSISISGAFALYPLMQRWSSRIHKASSEYDL